MLRYACANQPSSVVNAVNNQCRRITENVYKLCECNLDFILVFLMYSEPFFP